MEEARSVKRVLALLVALATVAMLSSCGVNPGSWLPRGNDQLAADRMVEIVEAVNSQDAAALKGMFTEHALAEYSEQVDEGLTYLLSLFPDGDLVWENPESRPSFRQSWDEGRHTVVVPANFRVSSGGKDYWLFFSYFTVNEQDPDNVGIYGLGAAPRTETKSSGPERVFFSWNGSVSDVLGENGPPGVYIPDYDHVELADRMMEEIVEVDLKIQDPLGLRQKFTQYAQAEFATAIDEEIDEFFALFPDGDIVWEPLIDEPEVRIAADGENETVLLLPVYRVSADGKDYWLFFADYTVNTIDPDNLGLYAIGVAPRTASGDSAPEKALFEWADTFDVDANTPPGILIAQ
jgi:hypothetical protein